MGGSSDGLGSKLSSILSYLVLTFRVGDLLGDLLFDLLPTFFLFVVGDLLPALLPVLLFNLVSFTPFWVLSLFREELVVDKGLPMFGVSLGVTEDDEEGYDQEICEQILWIKDYDENDKSCPGDFADPRIVKLKDERVYLQKPLEVE